MLARWARFEASFGPLTIQERLDVLFAATLARGTGKPVKDFLPQWGDSQDPTDLIVARLEGMAKRKPKEAT
jgi:hypothetical protein